jgi:peroxiredoxin
MALLLAGCATTGPGESLSPGAGQVADYRNSRAEVVVLSFFDMYCPHCHTAAKHVNQAYDKTRAAGLGSRVEFFAIGWGNTPMECEMYRKRFNVRFKIVPDRDLSISRRFGKFRPPLLVALRKQGGSWSEIYRVGDVRGKADEIYANIQP